MQRTSSKTKADNFYTSFSNDEKKNQLLILKIQFLILKMRTSDTVIMKFRFLVLKIYILILENGFRILENYFFFQIRNRISNIRK